MRNIIKEKRAAVLSAAVFAGLMLLLAAVTVLSLLEETVGEWVLTGTLLFCGVLFGALIVGVVLALKQRLAELKRGEEEDARHY